MSGRTTSLLVQWYPMPFVPLRESRLLIWVTNSENEKDFGTKASAPQARAIARDCGVSRIENMMTGISCV